MDEIIGELRQFVDQSFESLIQLEALLLFWSDPKQSRTVADVARELYVDPQMCEAQLAGLERRSLLIKTEDAKLGYRYRAGNAETDRLVSDLAELYQRRRTAVISLIYSKPVNQVQTFADSFRLRKDG